MTDMPRTPYSPFRQMLILGVIALVFAGAASLPLNPARLDLNRRWAAEALDKLAKLGLARASLDETARAVGEGSRIILDARKLESYQEGHLPTAMPLPVSDFANAFGNLSGLLATFADPLLVYCSGADCDESVELAVKLRDIGYTNIVVYAGGFDEWKAAGRPVE